MPHREWLAKLTKDGTQAVALVVTVGMDDGDVLMRLAMPPEVRGMRQDGWEYFWEQVHVAAEKLRETPMDDLSWV